MDKIYISIASYKDKELADTIYNLLNRAKNIDQLFISIFSQDDNHPNLQNIFDFFDTKNFNYIKVNTLEARGVGYARYIAQNLLSNEFKYYLQIDSHSRFIQNWDEVLIAEYKNSQDFWKSDIIFSSYPLPYSYDDNGNEQFTNTKNANITTLTENKNSFLYKVDYEELPIADVGECHGHFCAGFAFGLSEYFLKVPYDKFLYFEGEEHLMSIRFFCQNIKIIAPGRSYIYHHYYGNGKRGKHWEDDPNWALYQEQSLKRIKSFFYFEDLGIYGISNIDKYNEWKNKFLKKMD